MFIRPIRFLLAVLLAGLSAGAADPGPENRWPLEKAQAWYASLPWLVGANFLPSTAINQLEMWQDTSFDPETIDRELGWAADLGMNTMRVYLHDIPWREDAEVFLQHMDRYLSLADGHDIRTLFVIFDSVWHPYPKAGRQPDPVPRRHNSGWVQSPGRVLLEDPGRHDELKPYVQAVLHRFRDDSRVLAWDLFNEPDNANVGKYGGDSRTPDLAPELKCRRAAELLEKAFAWAREVNPSQPLTAAVWGAPRWLDNPDAVDTLCLELSDVLSFHSYAPPGPTAKMVNALLKRGRPLLCTEYMSRGNGATFAGLLPVFKQHRVGAWNWGLVNGKSQTIYPWDSWDRAYHAEPDPWFHDVLRKDGTPYDEQEARLIQRLTRRAPSSP